MRLSAVLFSPKHFEIGRHTAELEAVPAMYLGVTARAQGDKDRLGPVVHNDAIRAASRAATAVANDYLFPAPLETSHGRAA
jgi:hypothetical protein